MQIGNFAEWAGAVLLFVNLLILVRDSRSRDRFGVARNRAHLHVLMDRFQAQAVGDGKTIIDFTFSVENIGASVAKNVVIFGMLQALDVGQREMRTVGALNDIERGMNTVGQVASHILPLGQPLRSNQNRHVMESEEYRRVIGVNSPRRLYLCGFVKYEDILGTIWVREFKRGMTIEFETNFFATQSGNYEEEYERKDLHLGRRRRFFLRTPSTMLR